MSTKPELTPAQKAQRITALEQRKLHALEIAVVPSHNPKTPEKMYPIMLAADNTVFCMCEAYKYNTAEPQTCKHLDDFRAVLRQVKR